jgi:hypothetical protein
MINAMVLSYSTHHDPHYCPPTYPFRFTSSGASRGDLGTEACPHRQENHLAPAAPANEQG